MIKLTHTNRTLTEVGVMLRKGLQDELIAQKHNATGRLSRGLKYHIKGSILNVISSVAYWKAVNNPKFAKKPNLLAIRSWAKTKGLPARSVVPIWRKLQENYGQPYVVWTEGNSLRRTDFAGHTANKFSKQVADKLAPSVGVDVANMIASKIRKNTKAKVTEAF
jgi:hypothetical protein|tara:strand:+ start:6936 stop:7427 length:492 start_codon:yes stop_codon:yes gene_type:complete